MREMLLSALFLLFNVFPISQSSSIYFRPTPYNHNNSYNNGNIPRTNNTADKVSVANNGYITTGHVEGYEQPTTQYLTRLARTADTTGATTDSTTADVNLTLTSSYVPKYNSTNHENINSVTSQYEREEMKVNKVKRDNTELQNARPLPYNETRGYIFYNLDISKSQSVNHDDIFFEGEPHDLPTSPEDEISHTQPSKAATLYSFVHDADLRNNGIVVGNDVILLVHDGNDSTSTELDITGTLHPPLDSVEIVERALTDRANKRRRGELKPYDERDGQAINAGEVGLFVTESPLHLPRMFKNTEKTVNKTSLDDARNTDDQLEKPTKRNHYNSSQNTVPETFSHKRPDQEIDSNEIPIFIKKLKDKLPLDITLSVQVTSSPQNVTPLDAVGFEEMALKEAVLKRRKGELVPTNRTVVKEIRHFNCSNLDKNGQEQIVNNVPKHEEFPFDIYSGHEDANSKYIKIAFNGTPSDLQFPLLITILIDPKSIT